MNQQNTASQQGRMQIPQWKVWAHLIRLPNVFTIIADITAAYLFTASAIDPIGRFTLILSSGICLYWAGMILNDVFDVEIDTQQRAKRPIPAGWVSKRDASRVGWGLLLFGVVFAFLSGFLPSEDLSPTILPGIVSILLALMIVAYNGPLKAGIFAPLAMGSCRFLSFLLGASPCLALAVTDSKRLGGLIPSETVAIAIGFGIYIMGVTTMARKEAVGGSRQQLIIGSLITTLGAFCLAVAPRATQGIPSPKIDTENVFPVLIGMIVLPVLLRAIRAIQDPIPQRIQITIKAGVLTIIPLSAAFTTLGAGPIWGGIVFALVLPSLWLSARFRVT